MVKTKTARGEKSDAIRNFRLKNPAAKPKAIAASLNQAGLKVTPQYVSRILSNDRKKKRVTKPAVAAAVAAPVAASSAASSSFDHLLAVKKLVDNVGGIKAAEQAIYQFAKLMA